MTKAVSAALQQFRALGNPLRLRVTKDRHGFPIVPGRYGQIEWFDGQDLAVYSNHPRAFPKLWATPGVRPLTRRCGPSSRPRPSSRWRPSSGPSAGVDGAGDGSRIWSQTPDKRVLPGARIASRPQARPSGPPRGRTVGK